METPTPAQTEVAESFVLGEGWYENDELRLLPGLLAGVKTFVDVGASIGPYTKCANETIKNGHIAAIEANPDTYQRLKTNCQRWRQDSGNTIETLHAAVADAPGKMDFFIPGENESSLISSIFENTTLYKEWQKVPVDCVTLDSLFPESSPEFIKVDVEGAEYRVLKGAHGLLTRGASRFLIEIHPWGDPSLNKTPADVFQLLYSYDYDFSLVKRHWLFAKVRPSLLFRIKHQCIMFVMRNVWLKEWLKKIVLRFYRLRKP
ncbi:MAG: FkbM family methyltransferase [Methylacidiphilales bacterium]|nr:FkbM family methyltransferase [Candidatus Methylacidiphilales bacterium]